MGDRDRSAVDRAAGMDRRRILAVSALGAALGSAVTGLAGVLSVQKVRAQTAAGGKLQEVLQRGHLMCGTGSTNPPWHFEDDSGALVGMDIDMARLLAKGLFNDPSKVEFVRQEADARIPSLATGKVDIVFQFMTVTDGRAQQVEFTIPYYREGVTLFMPADSKFNNIADLRAAGANLRVAGLQNVYIEDWIHLAVPQATVDQFDSESACLEALNTKRVGAYMHDQSSVRWFMNKFPGHYKSSGYNWMPNLYSAAVRPGDQVWLNYVNTVLHDAMTGIEFASYSASFKKWFGVDLPTPTIGFPLEYSPRTS
jgi:polar amino acid transport system substrate-binding protein